MYSWRMGSSIILPFYLFIFFWFHPFLSIIFGRLYEANMEFGPPRKLLTPGLDQDEIHDLFVAM